jgi:hypothetical protein
MSALRAAAQGSEMDGHVGDYGGVAVVATDALERKAHCVAAD